MATVDTEKMKEITADMSDSVHKLKENIKKLVEATKNAQSLKDEAMSYNSQPLAKQDEEELHISAGIKYIYGYKASVKNEDGGTASSGMRSITGAPKEQAYSQIQKILNLTESDIPAAIECIEEGKEDIEATFADMAMGGSSGSSGGGSGVTPKYKSALNTIGNTIEKLTSNTQTDDNNQTATLANIIDTETKETTSSQQNTPAKNTGTSSYNPSTHATIPTEKASHTGGGYSNNKNFTTLQTGKVSKDDSTKNITDSITSIVNEGTKEIINKGKEFTIIPESINNETSSASGSAVIPVAAGLSTAAAAALGAKMVLDKKKNENEEDISINNWTGDIKTDIDYNDGIQQQEVLDDDVIDNTPANFAKELTNI